MKKLLEFKLKFLAKAVLAKYRPEIIGITGSVGKTSAREAIFAVISAKFKARQSVKNYNNEIGLPLTIIGAAHPRKSFWGWIFICFKACGLLVWKKNDYPKILILEMGVDRPGDMKYLLGIVKPKIGVITKIGESHLEFFKSVDEIKDEKGMLVKNLTKDGCAVLNFDDKKLRELAASLDNKKITYGLNKGADIAASEIIFSGANNFKPENMKSAGMSFKLNYKNKTVPVFLPGVINTSAVSSSLAGAAVGLVYGMNMEEIAAALKNFKQPRGRMNLLAGVKNTLIIDDTYNASPQSTIAAFEVLNNISAKRKIAALGDMLELGSYTEEGHRLVGKKVFEVGVDELIIVGERARDIGRGAKEAGMKEENIFYFPNSDEAKSFVQERIREGDLILIKGSQGARMEKIVKEIMAEPARGGELLVRQGKEWK